MCHICQESYDGSFPSPIFWLNKSMNKQNDDEQPDGSDVEHWKSTVNRSVLVFTSRLKKEIKSTAYRLLETIWINSSGLVETCSSYELSIILLHNYICTSYVSWSVINKLTASNQFSTTQFVLNYPYNILHALPESKNHKHNHIFTVSHMNLTTTKKKTDYYSGKSSNEGLDVAARFQERYRTRRTVGLCWSASVACSSSRRVVSTW